MSTSCDSGRWLDRTYGSSDERNPFLLELLLYPAHPNDVDLLVLG